LFLGQPEDDREELLAAANAALAPGIICHGKTTKLLEAICMYSRSQLICEFKKGVN
jgi:hypothetical protein